MPVPDMRARYFSSLSILPRERPRGNWKKFGKIVVSIEGKRISRAGVRESSVSLRRVRNNLLNYRMPKVTSARREAGVGGGILHEGVGGVDARAKRSDDAWTAYFAESRTPVQLSTINENWPIREPRIHRASTRNDHRKSKIDTIILTRARISVPRIEKMLVACLECVLLARYRERRVKRKKKFRIRKWKLMKRDKKNNESCAYMFRNKIYL